MYLRLMGNGKSLQTLTPGKTFDICNCTVAYTVKLLDKVVTVEEGHHYKVTAKILKKRIKPSKYGGFKSFIDFFMGKGTCFNSVPVDKEKVTLALCFQHKKIVKARIDDKWDSPIWLLSQQSFFYSQMYSLRLQ